MLPGNEASGKPAPELPSASSHDRLEINTELDLHQNADSEHRTHVGSKREWAEVEADDQADDHF